MAFLFRAVVYINGVRFDITSATYEANDGGDYHFSVNVPAVPEWDILPERSHGALFFIDPVTSTWRFMCEGEYVSTSKAKNSSGGRARSLYFRSIHGWWNQANYVSIASMVSPTETGSDTIAQVLYAQAMGQRITYAASDNDNSKRIESLSTLLNKAAQGNAVSAFIPLLIQNIALQTPVEAFYMVNRKLNDKIFALKDDQLETIIGLFRLKDITANGFNTFGLGPNTTLDTIIRSYEDIIFYKKVPLPAPCFTTGSKKITEMFWTPHLYTVMPPVCNVIFDAQQTSQNEQRNFMTEPTRVIAQVQLSLTTGKGDEFPIIYMANQNNALASANPATAAGLKSATNVSVGMTHDFLSAEELLKGVIASPIAIGLEKVTNTSPNTGGTPPDQPNLTKYVEAAVLHQYFIEHSKSRTKSISCVFLPYLVPGFPCLVEDSTGPVFGIISSLTHTLTCDGKPFTMVQLSHVRPAFVTVGADRSPTIPFWLNTAFIPANVESTFKNLLGINSNDIRNYSSIMLGDTNPDMDVAATQVVAVPKYNTGLTAVDNGYVDSTISEQLALKPDPALAYLQFQYRNGLSLSDYAEFHGLTADGDTTDPAGETADLVPDLSPGSTANELFGSPSSLLYTGVANTGPYGVYSLDGSISLLRQTAARTIAAAISKIITAN